MSPEIRLALLSLAAIALFVLSGLLLWKLRTTPAERERKRRRILNRLGRMHDGMLTDVGEDIIYFSYWVSGVSYNASQDLAAFRDSLPVDLTPAIGAVTLKYLPRNPANSIVICEGWSGLRFKEVAGVK